MNQEYQTFRSLTIWQKAQDLAALIITETDKLPNGRSVDSICRQLVRSAGSVPANAAEGYGRFSDGAFRNHLSIARGSLFETESWLDLLQRTGHLSPESAKPLLDACHEVGRLLTARMNQMVQYQPKRIREERAEYLVNDDHLEEGEAYR